MTSPAISIKQQKKTLRQAKRRSAAILRAVIDLSREGKRIRFESALTAYLISPQVMLSSYDRAHARLHSKRWTIDYPSLRGLHLLTPPREALSYYFKKKRCGGTRTIVVPGIERLACQIATLDLLKKLCPLKSWQYDRAGFGRDRAIDDICTGVQNGHHYFAVCDIADCFQSFDRDEIAKLLPLPRLVTKYHVLLCDQNGSNASLFEGSSAVVCNKPRPLQLRGLPQGSVLSNYVASILLSNLDEIVGSKACLFLYRDDIVLLAKTATGRDEALLALIDGLKSHRAGCLRLRHCKGNVRKETLAFLGYEISKKGTRPVVRLSEANKNYILSDLWQPANADRHEKLLSTPRTRAYLERRLSGFRRANVSDIRSQALRVARESVRQSLPVVENGWPMETWDA